MSVSFQVVVTPPLYRHQPLWYQSQLSQVATRFSASFSAAAPQNLFLIPSFSCQDLMPDGVHLTPVSGLHYVLHVFDQSDTVLTLADRPSEVQLIQVKEQVRHHDDRLAYLESRHGKLSAGHDLKIASDAELADWHINKSEENWLTILGLTRLGQMSTRDWHEAVCRQIVDVIRLVLKTHRVNLDFRVLHAVNPIRGRTTGQTVVNVLMDSPESSKRIRDLYSAFFSRKRHNQVQLPNVLKGVSIRNKVTLNTRIRIAILQELGANYLSTNPGSSIHVKGYDPRPVLITFPPSSSNSRPRSFNFIDAVKTLPANLSDASLSKIFQKIGEHHPGSLRQLFVILSDDDRERCKGLVRANRGQSGSGSQSSGLPSAPISSFGHVSGVGSGMDQNAVIASLKSPPPPPPPLPSTSPIRSRPAKSSARRSSSSRSPSPARRGLKRHQQSPRRKSRKSRRSKRSRRAPSSSSSSSSGSSSDSH